MEERLPRKLAVILHAKGLNPLVQKSLDVVRVIGNEAVHPGVIDLKDDRDTATKLYPPPHFSKLCSLE